MAPEPSARRVRRDVEKIRIASDVYTSVGSDDEPSGSRDGLDTVETHRTRWIP